MCSILRKRIHDEMISGVVMFELGFPYENKYIPFLKVHHDVDINEITPVLKYEWQLPSPRIALMVVSDAAPLHIWKNYKQIKAFTKGLIKAANTTTMWICTHGMNVGIVKIIGDAVEKEILRRESLKCHKHQEHKLVFPPIVLLGICKDKLVSYASKLVKKDSPINLHNEGNSSEELKYDLNPFHSHFIVVSAPRKGSINTFTIKLEQHFVQSENPSTSNDLEDADIQEEISEVPIVALLIQGDLSSIQTILSYIKRNLPVVVIESSGGVADLIAYAYYEINRRPRGIEDAEYVENILKPELNHKISHNIESQQYNDSSKHLYCERILECIRYSQEANCLTILNLSDPNCKLEDLTVHLFQALFKSQKTDDIKWSSQMEKDLYLAMDWNCPDVAKREVFFKDPSRKFEIGKKLFEAALLRPHREEFASLFLSRGFKVYKYLNSSTLLLLFRHSLKKAFFSTVCWLGVLGHTMITDIGIDFLDSELNWLIEELTGIPAFVNSQELDIIEMLPTAEKEAAAERKARTILTIWAVLSNRTVLAKLLWMHSDYPISLALVISMIFHKLHSFVSEIGQKEEMEKQSKEFAEMAVDILEIRHNEMPCRAYDVLNEENPDFLFHTNVKIAALAGNKIFLAHPCCQKRLDNMFLGDIRIRDMIWGNLTFPE